jgi:general secretion pathway protein J
MISSKGSGGFTLLEILIAIFIFSIVFSTIFIAYTGTIRVSGETESSAGVYGMARIALERMREDLESVYVSKSKKKTGEQKGTIYPTPFVGEDKEIGGRPADTLNFVSRGHLVFDGGGENFDLARITYYVKKDERGEGLVLYRVDTPVIGQIPEKGTGGLALCEGLSSINLIYHDSSGNRQDGWNSTGDDLNKGLPSMVSIMLELRNPSDPERPFRFMSGVALPMARVK